MTKRVWPVSFALLFLLCCASLCEAGPLPPLLLDPFLGRPTGSSITVNLTPGERKAVSHLRFGLMDIPKTKWQKTPDTFLLPFTPSEMNLTPLLPGKSYGYEVYARHEDEKDFRPVAKGGFRTPPKDSAPFSFAILSDAHITPFHNDRSEVLSQVSRDILGRKPDFLVMLGDNIQTFSSHGGPMTEERFGPVLYSHLRQALGNTPSSVPVFTVLGNWEGENGWHSEHERVWAKKARQAFIPNPRPDTYPNGGGVDQDYYGFTWGDVLFLALHVTGYTPADHTHGSLVGKADDWTIGEAQKRWLFEQLSQSKAKWKLLFIHHTVGGNAGDEVNSRYGRGGGRAAHVGEQATIHGWMKQFGVQALFYGHDHVFTDIVVDRIHYVCAGSAGAPWKFSGAETGYERYWTPSGYTWVEVGKDNMKVSFVEPGSADKKERILHSFEVSEKSTSGHSRAEVFSRFISFR